MRPLWAGMNQRTADIQEGSLNIYASLLIIRFGVELRDPLHQSWPVRAPRSQEYDPGADAFWVMSFVILHLDDPLAGCADERRFM